MPYLWPRNQTPRVQVSGFFALPLYNEFEAHFIPQSAKFISHVPQHKTVFFGLNKRNNYAYRIS